MPRTSGVELLRRVREQREEIPVVLMTGFAGLLNEQELQRYGIDEFIIKPLSSEDLGATLRRCLDPVAAKHDIVAREPAAPSPSDDLEVLIVDDDQMVLTAMMQLLSSLGYRPSAVSSIEAASQRLSNRVPKAMLVDQHLKGVDGFAAVPKLRELAAAGGTRTPPLFIGMTGAAFSEEPDTHALDGYLVKPFSADELRDVLQRDPAPR